MARDVSRLRVVALIPGVNYAVLLMENDVRVRVTD